VRFRLPAGPGKSATGIESRLITLFGGRIQAKMSIAEIHFLGVMANTDNTVIKLKLQHGFEFEGLPKNDVVTLISNIDDRDWFESFKDLSFSGCVPPNGHGDLCVVVKNSFSGNIEVDAQGRAWAEVWWPSVCDFQNKFVEDYLKAVLQLMRLFKEGRISLPGVRYFCYEANVPKLLLGTRVDSCSGKEPCYSLTPNEIPNIQYFLENTSLPFGDATLRLAHEDFELSYRANTDHLSFLTLMIAMEVLLNPSDRELRYRVSRNSAVLLGNDHDEAEKIFKGMKELYDKRSKLVHTGDRSILNWDDVLKLRQYARETIKEVHKTGMNKGDLLAMLNTCGFGQRPWRDGC